MFARMVVLGRSLQFLGINSGRRLGIHGNTKGLRTLSNAFNRSSSVCTCRYLGSTTIANAQSDVTKSQVKPAKVLGPEPRPVEVSGQNDHPGMLKVTWDHGRTGHYPYVWMKDNCQCPECFHQSSVARAILMRNVDINIQAEHIQVDEDKGCILVTWSDGHQSPYPFGWLEKRTFREPGSSAPVARLVRKTRTWGAELQGQVPQVTFKELLEDDWVLHKWISTMEEIGLCVVKDAPQEPGQVAKIGQRIAYLRTTNYGELFTVKAKVDASNLAFTPKTLGLHTDLPYFNYVPGVQMLHCIKQALSKGGDNEFSDGFHAAKQIERDHQEDYQILTSIPVDYHDQGTDFYKFHLRKRTATITVNENGELERVTYNNQTRDSMLSVTVEHVYPLYKALRLLDDTLYDPANVIHMKLEEGDIICFHNYRVLHGRQGYTPIGSGERHLEGGYLDWDEIYSRGRVLRTELNIED